MSLYQTSTNSSIYLTRGGILIFKDGSLAYAGEAGYYMSSTAYYYPDYIFTYVLNSNRAFAGYDGYRPNGFTVQTVKPYQRWLLFDG